MPFRLYLRFYDEVRPIAILARDQSPLMRFTDRHTWQLRSGCGSIQ